MGRGLEKLLEVHTFLFGERPSDRRIDGFADLGPRQRERLAEVDLLLLGGMYFQIPDLVTIGIRPIPHWIGGLHIEGANLRLGIALWRGKPHAHALGTFRHLDSKGVGNFKRGAFGLRCRRGGQLHTGYPNNGKYEYEKTASGLYATQMHSFSPVLLPAVKQSRGLRDIYPGGARMARRERSIWAGVSGPTCTAATVPEGWINTLLGSKKTLYSVAILPSGSRRGEKVRPKVAQ